MLVNSFVYIHSDRWRYIHQHTRDFSASDTANSAYVSRNGPGRRYTSPARPRSAHAPPSPRSSKRQFEAGRPEMGRGASLISAPDVTVGRYCRAQMLASQAVAQWLTKSMGNSRLRRSALRRRRRRHLPVESGTGRTVAGRQHTRSSSRRTRTARCCSTSGLHPCTNATCGPVAQRPSRAIWYYGMFGGHQRSTWKPNNASEIKMVVDWFALGT